METSELLTQYPLSPRKFWKKMIEKVIIVGILAVAISAITSMVLMTGAPSNMSFIPVLLKALVVGFAVFAVIMVLYGLYVSFYIKTYYYAHEEDFLTIRKGVFMPAEIHVQYLKMQDVYVDQDILDRILGIYDVHISSATVTSGIAAHIDGVSKEHATGLKNLFLTTIKNRTRGYTEAHASKSEAVHSDAGGVATVSQKVHLTEQISSDHKDYALDSNWWVAEWVKIAVGSLFTPAVITFFLFGRSAGKNTTMPHIFQNLFWIWLTILLIYIIGATIKLLLWKSNYSYKFTDQYIYMKEGIISMSEKNMPYNSIQDVQVKQGIIDRIFGVADVCIENASAGSVDMSSRNNKKSLSTGVVIEGLKLSQARHVADILKEIINNQPRMRGI